MENRRRSRSFRAAVFVALSIAAWGASSASASTTIDARGTYVGTAQADSGTYSSSTVIDQENCAAGTFSGGGVGYSTFSGTINGSTITTHEKYLTGSYTSDSTDTFSTDSKGRLVASGTFTDSNGHHGTNSGTRISKPKGDICGETVSVSLTPDKVNVCGNTCAPTNAVKATVSVTGADGSKLSGENVALRADDPGVAVSPVTDAGAGTYTATLHPSHTPGKVIVTATDNSATPAVSGSATLTQECVSRSSDGVAPRRGSRSVLATEALNRDCSGQAIAFNLLRAVVGGVAATEGLTLAYYGFQVSKTAPLIGTVAFFGGVAAAASGVNAVNAAHHALTDPPDPHFRSLVAVRPVRLSKFHARRGLSARAAKALNTYLTELGKVAAVAGTMATTIDRAGGAIAAANPEWEGRQIRYAIALTNTFKADVSTVSKDARSLSRSAKGSSALTGRLPIAKLRALQQGVAKHGVPARLVRPFRRYGITASQLRDALKGKPAKLLPRTMLQFLTGPATLAEFNNAAKAYLAWSKASQIIAESQLK